MACYCIGGENCCLRRRPYVPDYPMWEVHTPIGPFKCPDCGTWWTGEHRCPPTRTTNSTNVEINTDEQG